MSRFYADISGGRGTATRQGHAASGIRGHIRGWSVGVKIIGRTMPEHEPGDRFDIYATGGSSADSSDTLIGTVYRLQGDRIYFERADSLADIERTTRFVQ